MVFDETYMHAEMGDYHFANLSQTKVRNKYNMPMECEALVDTEHNQRNTIAVFKWSDSKSNETLNLDMVNDMLDIKFAFSSDLDGMEYHLTVH